MSAENLREQIAEAISRHRPSFQCDGDYGEKQWVECACGSDYFVDTDAGYEEHEVHLAEAVLAVLGEVTVTEEWGVSCLGDIGRRETRHDNEAAARIEVADTFHLACQPHLVRRTVVTTRRVGAWEEAE